MNAFPVLPAPTGWLSAPSRQYHRSSSGSPIRQQYQQHVDDLVIRLAPPMAAQSLRFPSGSLKECLDTATSSEQSFAMRAAIASSSIYEWWDELSQWTWPDGEGSLGFEEPAADRRIPKIITERHQQSIYPSSSSSSSSSKPKPADPMTPEKQVTRASNQFGSDESEIPADELWMGSLLAADVARYEARVAEIQREVEDLEVEDMKEHVLHHHILPLSPPSPPALDDVPQRSTFSSTAKFIRMDDLTAVVTAIVVQALPVLSKLHRLLDTWSVRVMVLKRIPRFLDSLNAAEAAIRAAWNAIRVSSNSTTLDPQVSQSPGLRRDEVSAMKSVVEREVSRAAQAADYMLDILDGWEDTIPDDWIDRIDMVEKEYGEWVAICERKVRETEWKSAVLDKPILLPPTQGPDAANDLSFADVECDDDFLEFQTSKDADTERLASAGQQEDVLEEASEEVPALEATHISAATTVAGFQTPPSLSPQSSFGSLRSESSPPIVHKALPEAKLDDPLPIFVSAPGNVSGRESERFCRISMPGMTPDTQSVNGPKVVTIADDVNVMGESNGDGHLDYEQNISSSPLDFRSSVRSAVTFRDMPTVNEIPGEDIPDIPTTPIESSFNMNDYDNDGLDLPMEAGTPDSRRMSFGNEDDQLQQQISEILESIPAKIHLSSQPSPALNHLNPPDFKMPRKAKPSSDGTRSTSAMSSRSGTPSFLLAPAFARTPRLRQQRSNQDIKLYHLSRSTGEAPIKLFIRPVGESGERVMVRVGGGWADLSEYLKEYASHHSRRSKSGSESKIEIRDLPPTLTGSMSTSSARNRIGSSPPSRPASSLGSPSSTPPLIVRKTRRNAGDESIKTPRTPLAAVTKSAETPWSEASAQSRSSSRLSWTEEGSSLGMSGPRAKNIEMSKESKAWVESVKERVRIASGELKASDQMEGKFGEIGKAGGTKRLFRKG